MSTAEEFKALEKKVDALTARIEDLEDILADVPDDVLYP